MGQLRGSATRALPPGPPAGATANRLRNVAEPMASTPTSRIQQSGEWTENGMKAMLLYCAFQHFLFIPNLDWSTLSSVLENLSL